jgi:hypothetical protein
MVLRVDQKNKKKDSRYLYHSPWVKNKGRENG